MNTVAMETNLDGNLCRCTGYRPIMDAMKSLATDKENGQLADIEVRYNLSGPPPTPPPTPPPILLLYPASMHHVSPCAIAWTLVYVATIIMPLPLEVAAMDNFFPIQWSHS